MKRIIFLVLACFLAACAGPNPNPGERITDVSWTSGQHIQGWPAVLERAQRGQPWAQLRMGIFYVYGWGVEQSFEEAAKWYARASVQLTDGDWANGLLVGAYGKAGYFNQNSDAYMARYNLSEFFLNARGVKKDNVMAYALINSVSKAKKDEPIFFCCEFSGGRYVAASDVQKRLDEIKSSMSTVELDRASNIPEAELVKMLNAVAQGKAYKL